MNEVGSDPASIPRTARGLKLFDCTESMTAREVPRRRYPKEFKLEASRLAESVGQREVARRRDVPLRLIAAVRGQEKIMSHEVVMVGGVRTAIGEFGESLSKTTPGELGALVVR